MKRIIAPLLAAAGIIFSAGCARDIIVSEALQIPEQAVIRTAYNLWYEDPLAMTTLNQQKGEILPFGTAVEIDRATDRAIEFRALPDNRKFRIEFQKQYRLQTPEEYLKELFTTRTPEEIRGDMPALKYEKLRRGIVEKGMTKGEVVLAFGPPCAYRTQSREVNTWLYPMDFLEYKRVIFVRGTVLEVRQL